MASLEKDVAILMANLKGAKKKPTDIITIAKSCRNVITELGMERASHLFEISQYQLRQIDKINELSSEAKKFVKSKKIGIEISYQIARLDRSVQLEALKKH
jgi:hypothetical protein